MAVESAGKVQLEQSHLHCARWRAGQADDLVDRYRRRPEKFFDGAEGIVRSIGLIGLGMPASGYAFPVTQTKSWHSAARTTEEDGERVSMMVTYYVDEGFGWRLNNRLRRAGLRVGIRPRG